MYILFRKFWSYYFSVSFSPFELKIFSFFKDKGAYFQWVFRLWYFVSYAVKYNSVVYLMHTFPFNLFIIVNQLKEFRVCEIVYLVFHLTFFFQKTQMLWCMQLLVCKDLDILLNLKYLGHWPEHFLGHTQFNVGFYD